MGITHITRGEEWIPSTPAHLQIFDAFGWELPVLVHGPLLLNTDRTKISKRKHPWSKVSWFEDEGFLPEAVVNYLGSLIAHVPDPDHPDPSMDRELFGFDEIVEHLDLSRIGPSGKIIDLDKLGYLNGHYIRRLPLPQLAEQVRPHLQRASLEITDEAKFQSALALEQERLRRLSEAPGVLSFFFHDEAYDPRLLLPRGLLAAQALEYLRAARTVVSEAASGPDRFTAAALEERFRDLAARLRLTTGKERGQLFGVVRVAITGRTATPPLFDTMEVLGPETVQHRMADAEQKLITLAAQPA
jgi:glutamyl-tRNA synthetase